MTPDRASSRPTEALSEHRADCHPFSLRTSSPPKTRPSRAERLPAEPDVLASDDTVVDSPGTAEEPLASSAKRLVDIKAALAFLSIGRTKLNELLAAGDIESVHIGRSRLIPLDALEGYVDRLRDQARCVTPKGHPDAERHGEPVSASRAFED